MYLRDKIDHKKSRHHKRKTKARATEKPEKNQTRRRGGARKIERTCPERRPRGQLTVAPEKESRTRAGTETSRN